MRAALALLVVLVGRTAAVPEAPADVQAQIAAMKPDIDRIVEALTDGEFRGQAWRRLADFTDTVGNRISGSPQLDMAIDYMQAAWSADGLNATTEPALVPSWHRGNEWAVLKAPLIGAREYHLKISGLGRSIGTPSTAGISPSDCVWGGGAGSTAQQLHPPTGPGRADPRCGIEGEVVVVDTLEELAERGAAGELSGKIVVAVEEWGGYGASNRYRGGTAREAARYGAIGALVRSVAPYGLSNPHTGGAGGSDGSAIPTASIAVSDAHMLRRMQQRGSTMRIQMYMEAQVLPDVNSRNTIGELVGTSKPEEKVLVSGHLDSWDVGFGAMDDAGGLVISWQALSVIEKLGLRPKRSLRVIGWTCEEMGGGARAFWASDWNDPADYSLVMESDNGVFDPRGMQLTGSVEAHAIFRAIAAQLPPRLAAVTGDGEGADISPAMREGAPGASPLTLANTQWIGPGSATADPVTGELTLDPSHGEYGHDEYHFQGDYFFYHHSDADTMEIMDSDQLDRATAMWAVYAYVVANLDEMLPRLADGEEAPTQAVRLPRPAPPPPRPTACVPTAFLRRCLTPHRDLVARALTPTTGAG
jgi:carboxypeptidase Q